ncbi:MAG: ATP-binding cassette domain-containing protein [Candidatus Izemoplasmatales bacterium]|jgi:putative ABC transport system permease protein
MIKISKINKYFNKGKQNEIHVINNTSITFPETGLVALTGPSGCGKTTLLNVIGGLDKFHSGEIDFDGNIINKYDPLKWDIIRNKYVGYIFQNYYLLSDKTVYENIETSLNIAGLYDKEKIEERINYVLESVGMYNYRRRNVQALSGGQQQRVAIARAIAKNPMVVLADEPTGNLDANNTFEIMSIIKKISETCLVILVSHEKKLVDFYADRVIEIRDGMIVNDYQNEGNRTIDRIDSRNIYLLDLKKESGAVPIEVDYYYDETISPPKVQVVSVNNTVYVKADSTAKIKYVTEDSEIRLLNEHYKKAETSDASKHKFDLSKFGVIVADKARTSFIRFRDTLKSGFKKVFRKKKFIGKVFLFAYVLISALIAYNLATITNLVGFVDRDFLTVSRDSVAVKLDDKASIADIDAIIASGHVNSVNPLSTDLSIKFRYSDFYQGDISTMRWYASKSVFGYPVSLADAGNSKIVLGRLPANNREIAIDKWIADDILETQEVINLGALNYQDLLGKFISNNYIPQKIKLEVVGIVDTDSPIMIVSDGNFSFFNNFYELNTITAKATAQGDYTIVEGKDIANTHDVLVLSASDLEIGDTFLIQGETFTICGKYISDTLTTNIIETEQMERLLIKKVVQQAADSAYYWWYQVDYYIYFHADDPVYAAEQLTTLGYEAEPAYALLKDNFRSARLSEIASKIRFIGIAMLGSIIYLILTMRSSLLGRVKEVGIYRSIGATKKDIHKIFWSEIIAYTVVGSFTGYTLMTILIMQFQKYNPLAVGEFYFPFHYFLAGLLGIFALNSLFGMIPVFSLLRKTPAEITTQYDV